MRTAAVLLTALPWPVATAPAAELNLYVTSNGEATVVVEPGATVPFEVTGLLTDTDNEGLSFFLFDLTFDGGPLGPVDTPAGMPLTNFTPPEGFANPEGYEGAVIDGVLHQVGGSQNTLKSPLMTGSVITGLGHKPIVLATGSLTAPLADGAYTLTSAEILGRVIADGDDGSGEIWATEWAFEGEVSGLQVFVGPECTTVADCADLDGDLIRDDVCVWWDCVDNACLGTDVIYGDMAGHSGKCMVDGGADTFDFTIAVLYCFSNSLYPSGPEPYACEDNAPQAMNVDIGRRSQSCMPDGVCDANDYYLGLMIFGNMGTCSCPLDRDSPRPLHESEDRNSGAEGSGARLFMAPDGHQQNAASSGNTMLVIEPGTSRRVMVWMQDTRAGEELAGYQVILQDEATPIGQATGMVSYVNNDPGMPGGDSLLVDSKRPDWVFSNSAAPFVPKYTEPAFLGAMGLFYKIALPSDVTDPGNGVIHYLLEFDLAASLDASGEFELSFIRDATPGTPRPLTDLFQPYGAIYPLTETQSMTVVIGPPCVTIADCADLDDDGIRDDGCVWWGCEEGQCYSEDIVFADMGGQFGQCAPDGAPDGNDRFLALTCFAGQGWNYGECEPNPPAAMNIDAGGPFNSCAPDGVCDGNDAFHALNAFNSETSCSCPLDGAPMPEVEQPVATGRATIELRSTRKQLRPGEIIAIEAYLTTPLDDLRGYQLHLGIAGGTRGHLDLVDISIDRRRDAVFAEQSPWTAFNVHTGQMVAGLDTPGIRTASRTYLATFTWRASRDAAGPFRIELLADGTDSSQRTFLFRTDPRAVTEIGVEPVTVEVVAGEKRGDVR